MKRMAFALSYDMGELILRSLSDYTKNLKFVIPRLFEYFFDFFVLLAAVILSLMTAGFYLLSPSWNSPLLFFLIFAVLVAFSVILLLNAFARTAIIGMAVNSFEERQVRLSRGIEIAERHSTEVFAYTFLVASIPIAVALGILHFNISMLFAFPAGALFLLAYFFTLFTPQQITMKEMNFIDAAVKSFFFVKSNFIPVLLYFLFAAGMVAASGVVIVLLSFFNSLACYLFFLISMLLISSYLEIVKTYMVMEGDEIGNGAYR